ncbi:MAG: tetratricopeptide repeat protein [Candidatus Omnitrophota bacterium]
MGKSKWIEFRDNTDSDRYSQPSYRKATDFFRKVLGMIPHADAHQALAESYLDEGLEDKAIEEYKKTLQLDEHSVEVYLALANIYRRRESYKEAWELMKKAESMIPDNPDIKDLKKQAAYDYFLETGVKTFEGGDRLKARELLNSALDADPNSAQVYYLLAYTFDEQQDFDQVEEHLKKAISLDPKFYLALHYLGDVYFGRGDFEAAIEQYQSFLDIKGDDSSVLNNMGLAYMNLERYGEAIPRLQKALAFDPLNIEVRHNLSAVYRDQGMLDKAAEGFDSIIDMDPGYPNVHNDLGGVYRKQGRDQEALTEFRATIEYGQKRLSPTSRDPLLLVELAYAYNEIKEYNKAKKLIDEALKLDPNNQKAYWTLANIYKSAKRFDTALAVLDKAKKLSSKKYLFIEEAIADIKEEKSRSGR